MKPLIFLFIFASAAILFSCSGNSSKKDVKPLEADQISSSPEPPKASADVNKPHPGEAVYNANCLVCHQADGSGVPGMYPPLWPNEWISKDKEKMIQIMLKGLKGEIQVGDDIYNNEMPPHNQMSDQEIADVLTYVRSNFGNEQGAITKEEVAAARQE